MPPRLRPACRLRINPHRGLKRIFSFWKASRSSLSQIMIPNAVPLSEDPFADRRAAPRVGVALPGFMTTATARTSVQLLDVSAGGAKLAYGADDLTVGTVIKLDCGMVRRVATVRWTGGGLVGVSFDRDLDERETGALLDRSTALEQRMRAQP